MLVTKENFKKVMDWISKPGKANAIDSETTGLEYWGEKNFFGDPLEIFSVIVARGTDAFYFNFNTHPSVKLEKWKEKGRVKSKHVEIPVDMDKVLPFGMLEEFHQPFKEESILWFIHNAKFDMGWFGKYGLRINGTIHDTEAQARVLRSDIFRSNLDICAKRMNAELGRPGMEKSDAVMEYLRKNKLIQKREIPGKKKLQEEKPFYKVPLNIIQHYGEMDVLVGYQLGMYQLDQINAKNRIFRGPRPLTDTVESERQLTKVCFKMEDVGVKVDREYCQDSFNFNHRQRQEAGELINKLVPDVNIIFDNTAKMITNILTVLNIPYRVNPRTKKPVLDKNFLGGLEHPIGQAIIDWRKADKAANTYFASYLAMADQDDVIHPNMRQGGTTTGRFSYWAPNLQNVTKQIVEDDDDAEEDGIVRRSFVPREDFVFVMMDYDQMEYRMMVDQAEDANMIQKINGGLDVHEATAEILKCDRTKAKTLNFLLAYGGGYAKLGAALGISADEAKKVKWDYFAKIPQVKKWFYGTTNKAQRYGYIINWRGRICYVDKEFAYRAPNYAIQGGCADVVKQAMINIDSFFEARKAKSRMVLQVHDELLFEIHKDEFEYIPRLKEMMELAYPSKHIPLTVGVDHSWDSWADKVKGAP